jgi:methionyl-tRNA synthetase
MHEHRLHEGLDAVLSVVRRANGFIDAEQPWKLARDPASGDRLDAVLGALVRALATVAVALGPFMPAKAAEIWQRLGGSQLPALEELPGPTPGIVPECWDTVLFPRAERGGAGV